MYIKHTDKTLKKIFEQLETLRKHRAGGQRCPEKQKWLCGGRGGGPHPCNTGQIAGDRESSAGRGPGRAQGRGDSVSGRTCVSQRGTPSAGRTGGDEASCNSEGAVRPSFHGNLQVF